MKCVRKEEGGVVRGKEVKYGREIGEVWRGRSSPPECRPTSVWPMGDTGPALLVTTGTTETDSAADDEEEEEEEEEEEDSKAG